MKAWEALQLYWHKKEGVWRDDAERKRIFHQSKNKKVIKSNYHFINPKKSNDTLSYLLRTTHYIDDNGDLYTEEHLDWREAKIHGGEVIEDRETAYKHLSDNKERRDTPDIETEERFSYDRRKAVQYADRWWNDANPAYHFFEVNDCTNYISQCLRAGGAPMRGQPNRSTGWWYSGDNWSYSWSVAHSFRWYLSESTIGLQGRRLENPTDLRPGDVICYDFEGNGRFDHTTIVVRKDSENMPLVNAHTNNSRNRYWTYEDSMAWTPNCEYIFFRIGNDV